MATRVAQPGAKPTTGGSLASDNDTHLVKTSQMFLQLTPTLKQSVLVLQSYTLDILD